MPICPSNALLFGIRYNVSKVSFLFRNPFNKQKTILFQKQPRRLFSKISVLFFKAHLFLDFSRRLHVFTKQIPIFLEGKSNCRIDTKFSRRILCSLNRYYFYRKPFSNINKLIGNFQKGTPL